MDARTNAIAEAPQPFLKFDKKKLPTSSDDALVALYIHQTHLSTNKQTKNLHNRKREKERDTQKTSTTRAKHITYLMPGKFVQRDFLQFQLLAMFASDGVIPSLTCFISLSQHLSLRVSPCLSLYLYMSLPLFLFLCLSHSSSLPLVLTAAVLKKNRDQPPSSLFFLLDAE